MKTLFTFCLLSMSVFCFGQTSFRTGISGIDYSILVDAVQLTDGNYVGVGYAEDYAFSNTDYVYLVKMNNSGTVLATKAITGDNLPYSNTEGIDIIKTSDGNLAVSGTFNDVMTLFKFDNNLNLLWQKQYTHPTADYSTGTRLLQTSDGGYMIAGFLEQYGLDFDYHYAGMLVKTNSTGDVSWSKQYFELSDDTFGDRELYDITGTSDGNYVLLINSYSNNTNVEDTTYLVKINGSGNVIWSKYISFADLATEVFSMSEASDGSLILSGIAYPTSDAPSNEDVERLLVIKCSGEGNVTWAKMTDNGEETYLYAWENVQDTDGGYILSGSSLLYDPAIEDYSSSPYFLKVSSGGTLQWTKVISDVNVNGEGYGLIKTADGGYLATGDAYSNNNEVEYGMMYKFNSAFGICGNIGTFGGLTTLSATAISKTPEVSNLIVTTSSAPVESLTSGSGVNLCSLLPLQLLTFNATLQNNHVNIEWKTANEINTDYFTVERGSHVNAFNALKTVPAKSNGSAVQTYTTTDVQPLPGTSYYRLKQADKDGAITYSGVVSVMVTTKAVVVISPNPVHEVIRVQMQSGAASQVVWQVSDMTGKILSSQTSKLVAGNNFITIPAASLSKGMYLLKVVENGAVNTIKLVKE